MAQLQDLFQRHAIVKILDFLTLYKDFEYTRTDIINETGISRRTLYQVWPILERFDLVKVTKSSGMIKFFKLNAENPISRALIVLEDRISFFEADRIAGLESTPILRAELPQYTSSSVTEESLPSPDVRVTVWRLTVKGTPSAVEEMVQKFSRVKNMKTKFSIEGSTGTENGGAKKKGRQLVIYR